ncbi:helix-turn-helix transcriptional regulator [Undibacterium danionis]|uniref:Helix-turn-helix transcriptional regulator n=1 Tax=Undibacterium danionis TaxID=1812100 RepID=A0ABV6IDX6_9BURK
MSGEYEASDAKKMVLEILKRIPRQGFISTSTLHQQLKSAGFVRDKRSIQRQLKTLSNMFDIERDERSKPYGYKWKANAGGLSLLYLSEQDSLLLALAEQHLKNLLPVSVMNSMSGFFEQARLNLNSLEQPQKYTEASRSREWQSKVRIVPETQTLITPKVKANVFEAVSSALYANHWLDVSYKRDGKLKKYKVMPLGLAQQGPRLYLVCRYDGHTNERSLAMHRLLSATVSTLTFERPVEFNLDTYTNDGRFGFGEGKRIQLIFTIDKAMGEHLLETPLSKDQTVEEEGDTYRISATVVDTRHLRRWLLGFGDAITEIDGFDL